LRTSYPFKFQRSPTRPHTHGQFHLKLSTHQRPISIITPRTHLPSTSTSQIRFFQDSPPSRLTAYPAPHANLHLPHCAYLDRGIQPIHCAYPLLYDSRPAHTLPSRIALTPSSSPHMLSSSVFILMNSTELRFHLRIFLLRFIFSTLDTSTFALWHPLFYFSRFKHVSVLELFIPLVFYGKSLFKLGPNSRYPCNCNAYMLHMF